MTTDAESVFSDLLADNERDVARLQDERRNLDEQITQLAAERYGLELALARLRGEPRPPAPSALPSATLKPSGDARLGAEWQLMPRSDAIERLLREAACPMTRRDLHTALAQRGRSDNLTGISSTLAHLRRYDRVESTGAGGEWRLISSEAQEAEQTPVETPGSDLASPVAITGSPTNGHGVFEEDQPMLT